MPVLANCTILLDKRVKTVHRPRLHLDTFALIVFDDSGAVHSHALLLTQIRVLAVPAIDTRSLPELNMQSAQHRDKFNLE